MSRSLNKVMLIGNVGSEPEIRQTPSGAKVAKVSLATNRTYTDRSGQQQEKTEWHRLTFWDRLADIVEQYVHKGDRLYVEGRIEYSQTEDEQGNARYWSPAQRRLVDHWKALDRDDAEPFTHRYIGSLVADFHRTLLYGGIFLYPADARNPQGKLRLLYEAAPLAFICEQAGGRASDGRRPILDIEPETLHQRTPLYIGSADLVEEAERFLAEDGPAVTRP